jgi:hypothetical protein
MKLVKYNYGTYDKKGTDRQNRLEKQNRAFPFHPLLFLWGTTRMLWLQLLVVGAADFGIRLWSVRCAYF